MQCGAMPFQRRSDDRPKRLGRELSRAARSMRLKLKRALAAFPWPRHCKETPHSFGCQALLAKSGLRHCSDWPHSTSICSVRPRTPVSSSSSLPEYHRRPTTMRVSRRTIVLTPGARCNGVQVATNDAQCGIGSLNSSPTSAYVYRLRNPDPVVVTLVRRQVPVRSNDGMKV